MIEVYVERGWWHEPRVTRRGGTETMAQTNRLHHDLEVAQRATMGLMIGLIFAAFLALALGAAIYDIGAWLSVW